MKDLHSSLAPHWLRRARDNQLLQQKVHAQLPEAMREHVQVIGVERGKLALGCDSPAWVTRLRFMESTLVAALRAEGLDCKGLRTRVLANATRRRATSGGRRPELGAENGRSLRQLADSCSDERLGAALRRLASRGSNRK